jgi:hypothetical protein
MHVLVSLIILIISQCIAGLQAVYWINAIFVFQLYFNKMILNSGLKQQQQKVAGRLNFPCFTLFATNSVQVKFAQ